MTPDPDASKLRLPPVVINDAIALRGMSGTAKVVGHIVRGLTAGGFEVKRISPPRGRGSSRVLNAVRAARWDLWQAGRLAGEDAVLISPCNVGMAPRSRPHVLWMQDTMVLDHPEWFDPGFHRYARLLFGVSAKRCSRLVTASQYTADRIAGHWPAVGRVEVIRWPTSIEVDSPRALPPKPWQVVMIAATEVHKNHVGAIEATEMARAALGEQLILTLIGPAGRAEEEVRRRIERADPGGSWIRRLEGISDAELEGIYRDAWILLQPSFDEGFCLPLTEAGAHGVPVVHSGRGAMPEVVTEVNAESTEADALSQRMVGLAEPGRYLAASRSALEDCRRMSPSGFAAELTRLIADTVASDE